MSTNPLDRFEHPRYRCSHCDRGVFLNNAGSVVCQKHGLLMETEVLDREC